MENNKFEIAKSYGKIIRLFVIVSALICLITLFVPLFHINVFDIFKKSEK